MKVTFFERLGAYFIDTIIVSVILSLICLGFGNNTSNTEKLMSELDTKLVENIITPEEYLARPELDVKFEYNKSWIYIASEHTCYLKYEKMAKLNQKELLF